MRRLLTIMLISSLLIGGMAVAEEYLEVDQQKYVNSAPSFIGWVPDRFIVVLSDQAKVDHDKDAGTSVALSNVTGFADLAVQFGVTSLRPQFPGSDAGRMATSEQARTLARHYKVSFTQGELEEAMAAYEAHPMVQRVEPIGIHTLYATPNDTYYDNPPPEYPYDQWHYWDSYGIRANTAWDSETGDQTVIVGDLDIGTMYDHGDLGGSNPPGPNDASTNGNIWVNANETPGNGVDDDGNGYVDDIIGWDFVESTNWYTYPCVDADCGGADNDPSDGDGHGTHTAGTIAAITNNGYAVSGVAGGFGDGTFSGGGNGVKVVPCRIGYLLSYTGQNVGVVIMDYVAEAMYYMADLKTSGWNVAAINCSFGTTNSGGLGAAADYLIAQDVVICVAAGNSSSSSPDYLGGRGDCLDVGATDQSGNNASFTNYGSWVDVAAPGVEILSTITDPADPTVDYISAMDGTSMACPHVAGVVGLLESFNPSLSAADKIAIITDPANCNPYGGSRDLGAGIVDARKCLDAAGGGCDLAADFSGSPTSGCAPLAVSFTDLSTGSGIDGWSWNFGDGGNSTAQNPSYTYNSAGTYSVSLTVSSSTQGCNDAVTKTGYITVSGSPTAGFSGSPTSGDYPLTVDFTDASADATGWSWDFGDGVGSSTQQNPSYTYDAAGTYTVTLTASNACGSDIEQKADYITVSTPPQDPPVADFTGSPTSGSAPLAVQFTDQSTNNPTSWSWDFGDGIGTSSAQNPSYTYNDPGTYTVTLVATNVYGSDTEAKLDYITVNEPAQATQAFANAEISVNGTTSGDYTYTHGSDNVYEVIAEELYTGHPRKRYSYLEHKWTIDVGSGGSTMDFYLEAYRPANSDGDNFVVDYSTDNATWSTLVTVASATEQVYSAALPGGLTGTVYIRVTDTDRNWDRVSLDAIYIDQMYIQYESTPSAPIADFSGSPSTGVYPLTVSFTDLSTGSPTSWSWDFGDGSGTSTAQNPNYTYNAPGTYTVSLTATNAYGSDTETKVDYIAVTDSVSASMHVSDIAVGRRKTGANERGTCTVTIQDAADIPVSGATVYVTATGPTGGNYSAVTATDGTVYFETDPFKKPTSEWCFEVTDVTHTSYAYNVADNSVTKACESGWVYGSGGNPYAIDNQTPAEFGLSQNHPNPFNPVTEISYSLPSGGQVTLEVYNILGQQVAVLVDGYQSAGHHSVQWDASRQSSGVYFYRLNTGNQISTRKMLLMK